MGLAAFRWTLSYIPLAAGGTEIYRMQAPSAQKGNAGYTC